MDNVNNQYLLAVDGGGTKTDVLCADLSGQILSQSQSGPTSLTSGNLGSASVNLREAIRIVLEKLPPGKINRLVMGVAGLDTPEEHKLAQHTFSESISTWQIDDFELFNDSVIALANGSDSRNAMILISGTGSNCWGINDQGMQAKAGGLDYLLTDEGSGYDIGRLVLHCAVKSADGRGMKTILEEKVKNAFHVQNICELKSQVYNPSLSKTEISNLSKLCMDALKEGDQIALSIFEYAINE
ncbi:MAG: hypothetical protein LBG64_02630, partial [Pseudomonadales bacterium]|nr:hypothetical protein [Pseudomonadales bacterium]